MPGALKNPALQDPKDKEAVRRAEFYTQPVIGGATFTNDRKSISFVDPAQACVAAKELKVDCERMMAYASLQEVSHENAAIYKFSADLKKDGERKESLGDAVSMRWDPQLATEAGLIETANHINAPDPQPAPGIETVAERPSYGEIAQTFINAAGKTMKQLGLGTGSTNRLGTVFVKAFSEFAAEHPGTIGEDYRSFLTGLGMLAPKARPAAEVEQTLIANYRDNLEKIVQESRPQDVNLA